MNYWLIKSEPHKFSFNDLLRDKSTQWDGVRNFLARNHLRAMKTGDLVLYYHSNIGKEIVGIAKIIKEAYPDPSAKEGDWSVVDVAAVKSFDKPITLETIKKTPSLKDMIFLRQGRLSVSPVTKTQFDILLKMGS